MSTELWIGLLIQLVIFGAMWGDLRRRVISNRQIGDERHKENQDILKDISADVQRINNSVSEHGSQLDDHENEINRLRHRDR